MADSPVIYDTTREYISNLSIYYPNYRDGLIDYEPIINKATSDIIFQLLEHESIFIKFDYTSEVSFVLKIRGDGFEIEREIKFGENVKSIIREIVSNDIPRPHDTAFPRRTTATTLEELNDKKLNIELVTYTEFYPVELEDTKFLNFSVEIAKTYTQDVCLRRTAGDYYLNVEAFKHIPLKHDITWEKVTKMIEILLEMKYKECLLCGNVPDNTGYYCENCGSVWCISCYKNIDFCHLPEDCYDKLSPELCESLEVMTHARKSGDISTCHSCS